MLTAGAMGLQTEVIGRVAGTAVATTYQTGAITRIAEAVTRRAPGDPGHPAVERGLAILRVRPGRVRRRRGGGRRDVGLGRLAARTDGRARRVRGRARRDVAVAPSGRLRPVA